MRFYADLHIHSKYSRATSRDCDLENLFLWAARKGITVVGTGDFTHPAWREELKTKLIPAEPGLFRLRPEIERELFKRTHGACQRPVRFMLQVEISTIYKKEEPRTGARTRKVHHLVYARDFEAVDAMVASLSRIGNLASDGRPILGLDSRHLLEIVLESGPGSYLVPAHIWTPWFSVLGSKSGFDAVHDCYDDLAEHIFAVETGLSSDPPMNWRISELDRYRLISNSDAHSPPKLGREANLFSCDLSYDAIRAALEGDGGFAGTVEFFPEEGKYHLDGHRKCGVRLEPNETRENEGRCHVCGKPLTVGVLSRVEDLADRPDGVVREDADPFRSFVPLPELISETLSCGVNSKTVKRSYEAVIRELGPELDILDRVPAEDIERRVSSLLAEGITRMRAGRVIRDAGYDGEYGVIRLFAPEELRAVTQVATLFDLPDPEQPPQPEAPAQVPEAPAQPELDDPPAGHLDPAQAAIVALPPGRTLITAGPGTGKTRTLTLRVARLISETGVDAKRCLAVTFTRRAAGELRERLESELGAAAEGLEVTTFHGLALSLLPDKPRVATERERAALMAEVTGLSSEEAERCLAQLSRLQRRGEAPSDTLAEHLARLHEAYAEKKIVDYDMLLERAVTHVESGAELPGWDHIFVDEYQDIDPLQYRLLRPFAERAVELCAIGDPDQSIYAFRGAERGFFLRFAEDYPGTRAQRLDRNYRSGRRIVQAATAMIGNAPEQLRPVRASALPVVLHHSPTERAEAELIAHAIERLLGGYSYFSVDSGRVLTGEGGDYGFADIAVLYRTAAQSAEIAEALHRAGIPYQRLSHGPLSRRPTVAALAERLRDDPPPGAVTAALRAASAELLADADIDTHGVMQAELELLMPLAASVGDDLEAFLAALATEAEIDAWDGRADRVALLTLHAAKGLEFPVVFIAGCEDGLLPLRFGALDAEAEAEERRLLYVGMTRARQLLLMCRAERRGSRERAPTPFVADLDESLLARRKAEPPSRRPRKRSRQLSLFGS